MTWHLHPVPPRTDLEEGIKLALVPHKMGQVAHEAEPFLIGGFVVRVVRINTWKKGKPSHHLQTRAALVCAAISTLPAGATCDIAPGAVASLGCQRCFYCKPRNTPAAGLPPPPLACPRSPGRLTWLDDHAQLVERMVLAGVVHVLAQEGPSRGGLQAGVRQTWAETSRRPRPQPCEL